jgi:hypothetical protein
MLWKQLVKSWVLWEEEGDVELLVDLVVKEEEELLVDLVVVLHVKIKIHL